MHVHGVCLLHRTEPHGVLALFTHHMQDHSHQQESVVGEGSVAGYREEGVRGGGGVRPYLLLKMHNFLSILTFKTNILY